MTLSPTDFFDQDIELDMIKDLTKDLSYVWQILPRIKPVLEQLLGNKQVIKGIVSQGAYISKNPVFIHETAFIEPDA